ncbi:MAG: FliO/MopB family protein [Chlamydiae bacterium]|nr:FliO/MopB family protein [Chlamydiota bacterium]
MRSLFIFALFFQACLQANDTLSQTAVAAPQEEVVAIEPQKGAENLPPGIKAQQPADDKESAQDSKGIEEQNKNFQNAIIKTFLSIVAFIALILLTIWFLRRLAHNRHTFGMKSHSMQILEKRLLSPKTTLYLMEVDGKKVVFSESMMDVKVLYSENNQPTSTALTRYEH